ncbi:MAG: hypothetical protein E5X41_32095 [Mesorhizobium sp.]|nr:MAG: hypothetical protein E5X41_32095 [Mesorhizobium sp.]
MNYRRVQLACGKLVLCEADNWYVPSSLTPQMNRLLDETTQPFGKGGAAAPVRRQIIRAELLSSPLPKGWEMDAQLPSARREP